MLTVLAALTLAAAPAPPARVAVAFDRDGIETRVAEGLADAFENLTRRSRAA